MPAASEAAGAPRGGGGVEQEEYEIRVDQGFVYKVPRGLYPDAAPSTTQSAAGPDPRAAGLRRRRRALLRLRDKRLRDLSRWEALASELLAPLLAPQPPASPPVAAADSSSAPEAAASSSSDPVAAGSSSSASILDDLLLQVDLQMELMKKARQWCDETNAVCDAHEATIYDSISSLPLWGCNPSELMAGLCSPAVSGNLVEHIEKQKAGYNISPSILTNRLRKRVTKASGSEASIERKRKKASGSTTTTPVTPASKMKSISGRAPFISASPGALTMRSRRRVAAKNESLGGS